MHRICLSFLFILFIGTLALGQIDNYEIEFPWSQDVSRVKQDSLGYIWFHDKKDFFRYDGHSIETLSIENLTGKNRYEYNFTGDIIFKDHFLIFFEDGALRQIDPKKKEITVLWELPKNLVFEHLYQDDNNDLWIFTSHTKTDERLVYSSDNFANFELAFDLEKHIGSQGVFWDFEINDANGIFYIHWRLGGLYLLDFNGKQVDFPLIDTEDYDEKYECSIFRLDNKNQFWRIYQSEFSIYNRKAEAFIPHYITGSFEFMTNCNIASNPALLNLRFLYEDEKGRIWLACAASYLVLYDPEKDNTTLFRKPLVDNLEGGTYDIKSLMEDHDGNIWGNKQGGLFKIREKEEFFERYAVDTKDANHPIYDLSNPTTKKILDHFHDFGIKNTAVHAIQENEENDIIFQDATFTFKIDNETKELVVLPIFNAKEKVYLYIDGDTKIFSVWDSYYKFDADYNINKLKAPINKIEAIFKQKNGRIWLSGLLNLHDFMFGELDAETLEYKGNYVDSANRFNFKNLKVNSIREDEEGDLWLGTNEGLLKIDQEKNEIGSYDLNLANEEGHHQLGKIIEEIQFIGQDQLWIRFKEECVLIDVSQRRIIKILDLNEEISGKEIKFIAEGDSVLWIGEKEGLAFHDFRKGRTFRVAKEDGIDTKGAVLSMERLADNRIAVGSKNGLYLFEPATFLTKYHELEREQAAVPLLLNHYSYREGKSDSLITAGFLTETPKIDLAYNDKMLKINYGLMNYNYPRRQIFSHILEGYESEWSENHGEDFTIYSSLPPGEYKFKVRGHIGNGNFSNDELVIPILVRQAWFLSWWFYLVIFSLTSGIIFLMLRFRFRQEIKRRTELEGLRMKISSDLHDDVGSILSGLAMQSEVVALYVDDKSKKELNEIAALGRSAIERMRDIVWALDSRRDKYLNLIDRMRGFAEDKIARANMNFTFSDTGIKDTDAIDPLTRQNVYLIFKEAITNILKHSNGDKVEIEIMKYEQVLELKVRDNGTSKRDPSGDGLGLSNMKMRAEKIGGKLSITYDRGFEVILRV